MEVSPNHGERHRDHVIREAIDDRATLILAGIEKALERRQDIDEMTARLIALVLTDGPDSALASYAYTGAGRNQDLRAEYLPIYHDQHSSDSVREIIDWFAAKIVRAEDTEAGLRRPQQPPGAPKLRNLLWPVTIEIGDECMTVSVRADRPQEELNLLPDTLTALMQQYGRPFTLFLGLPDVDATAPNLGSTFNDTYRGEFSSEKEIVEELTDAATIRDIVRRLHDEYLGGQHVEFHEDKLLEALHEHWDVIEHAGTYYVFAQ